MKLVVVTQWVRTDSSSHTWPKPSQQARSELHVHIQQWAYEAGGNEKTGGVIEPRTGYRCGRKDISPSSQEGKADGSVTKRLLCIPVPRTYSVQDARRGGPVRHV